MDPIFLTTAGVVGFVAAVNGIIGLCERALSLLDHARHSSDLETEWVRVGNILEVYLRLKDKLGREKHTMETEVEKLLLATNMCVHNKLTKVLKKLPTPGLQASVSNSQKKSINKNLEEVDRVLDSYMRVLQLERRSATEQPDVSNFLERNKLLQLLLDPSNNKVISKSALRRQDWYTDSLEVQPANARRVEVEGKTYMVERIALGKTPKETERRLSRLGKLLTIMRQSEDADICSLLRMSIIAREQESFCILSELEDVRYGVLEDTLPSLRGNRGRQVLLLIAEAVQSLHKMSLVHEGLNSHNILVHPDSPKIKLTGFASSRECLDVSDSAITWTPEADPYFNRRRDIFQAPERLAGARYSFECDVYSLGMVIAEVCIGRPLVQETEVGRDGIVVSAEQCAEVTHAGNEAQVAALVRDIVLAETASKRPLAVEITERLARMPMDP